MEKSKVYFTSMKTSFSENLPQKLERLIRTAGIGSIDFKNKYAAIKIHFGEPGNLAFLRPNYAAVVVKVVKELGGKAFLTDCNTLYVGGRKNALDHMDAAYQNGTVYLTDRFCSSTYQLDLTQEQRKELLEAIGSDLEQQDTEQMYFPKEETWGILMFSQNGEYDCETVLYAF